MSTSEARARAVNLRDRLQGIAESVTADPDLVRIAQDSNGHQIAVWQTMDGPQEFNVTQARTELGGLLQKHGLQLLKSRSGRDFRPELLTF